MIEISVLTIFAIWLFTGPEPEKEVKQEQSPIGEFGELDDKSGVVYFPESTGTPRKSPSRLETE